MSIPRPNLEDITEADLQALIASSRPEGLMIEYKRESYKDDADKGEFRKDVCAFANSHGGDIIIGMEEAEDCAPKIAPLTGDSGKAIERLESLIRDGIEPRITGIRMRAVDVEGGHVIVVRVPRSWNPPHRALMKGKCLFYLRNSKGAHEASVEELRMLFTLSATVTDRIRAFRQERLAKIAAGETPVPLANVMGKAILHIVPLSAFSLHDPVDLEKASKKTIELMPIGAINWGSRFTFDGFMTYRSGDECFGYTQLFRNGCIEATQSRLLADGDGTQSVAIPAGRLLRDLMPALPRYLGVLQTLDVPPPLVVMLTLEGTRDARLMYGNNQEGNAPPPIRESTLALPEVLIDSYGNAADYHGALRPALDALWNAGDAPVCTFYDASGNWTGPK